MNGLLSYDIYKAEHQVFEDSIDWFIGGNGDDKEKLSYLVGMHDLAETLIKQIGECDADSEK